jgi:hypothetical protein
MAGWDREVNWSRDALERIVVLLFALANLADLAAGAPFLRRRQVLGILNCGEIEARAFVIGISTGALVSADDLEQTDDAARLAVRLRALALMLCLLLAQGFALPGAAGPRVCRLSHSMSAPAIRWLEALPPPAFDTS